MKLPRALFLEGDIPSSAPVPPEASRTRFRSAFIVGCVVSVACEDSFWTPELMMIPLSDTRLRRRRRKMRTRRRVGYMSAL